MATNGVVEELRLVKDDGEIELIRRASAMLEPIYAALVEDGLIGRTEFDVAWRIHQLVREQGGDEVSFDPIVASGEAGALPHAEPRRVPIEAGGMVTIDLGASWTATAPTAPARLPRARPPELEEVYQLVLQAQQAGLAAVRPGVAGGGRRRAGAADDRRGRARRPLPARHWARRRA